MTTWLYCLFGNEEKLMPYFLRHYAPEVDRLIMLDGGSNDGTKAIIREYQNAVIEQSPFNQARYDDQEFIDYISGKYKEARRHADHVIIVDADEFLYTGLPLRDMLEIYKVRAFQAIGYQMIADCFPAEDRKLTDLVKVGVRDKIYDKTVIFDPALDVRFSVGRHTCSIDGYMPIKTGVKLLHYRYFGADWLAERNRYNYARRSEADRRKGHGYHSAPDHQGRYSAVWFEAMKDKAAEVI